jgi:hypothetical protein
MTNLFLVNKVLDKKHNMTTIKLLQHHHELLLNNYNRIAECPYYRDNKISLVFHDSKFTLIQPTLFDLLNLWKEIECCINDHRVYILSIRESNLKLSGTGIDIATKSIITGELKLDRTVEEIFMDLNKAKNTLSPYCVPLNYIFVELQSNKTEYLQYIDDLTNSFFIRLQLAAIFEGYDFKDRIKLRQSEQEFYLTISGFSSREFFISCKDEEDFKFKISMLTDHVRYSTKHRGYILLSNQFLVLTKIFHHPSHLLKDETIKDIIGAAKDFETIVQDFMKGKF